MYLIINKEWGLNLKEAFLISIFALNIKYTSAYFYEHL